MPTPTFKFTGEPLSEESSHILIQMLSNINRDLPLGDDADIMESFAAKMLLKRIEDYKLGFKLTGFFVMLSAITFTDTPAKIMILLQLANQYYKDTGKTLLGVGEWCGIFPFGVPSDNELKTYWYSQKDDNSPNGNMLDNPHNWVS